MSSQPPSPSVRVAAQRLAQLRHQRLRSYWLTSRPLILLLAACAAIVLGFWGFRVAEATRSGDVMDSGYRTVRLFGLASGDIPPPVPWQIQVSRILAPLLVGYAAVAGLIAIFREQAQLARLRLFARRHVVVCGLGEAGGRIARALTAAGIRVVVVEQERDHPAIAGCRRRGIAVVTGDATDHQVLADVRCDRARHIFASSGSDSTNLGVLAACRKLAGEHGWQPSDVHVLVDAPGLWRRLNTGRLERDGDRRLRVDFVSVPDLAGRAMADAAVADWSVRPRHHIAISAQGELGRRAAAHAIRRAIQQADEVVVTLIGPSAPEDRDLLLREAPWTTELTDLRVWPFDPADPAPPEPAAVRDLTIAFMCDADQDVALARAAGLASLTPDSDAPVYAVTAAPHLATALGETRVVSGRIHPVAVLDRVLGPDLLLDTLTERLARAKHEDHVRRAVDRGADPATDPSLVGWEELPEPLKESNRRFADDVGTKLHELHARVVPSEHLQAPAAGLELSDAELERLAHAEHDRWVTDLRADGWQPTAGAKDAQRKLHPSLVTWDELSEDEREKDRDPIRDLPAMLGAAGYALVPGR